MTAAQIAALIRGGRFAYSNEDRLQAGIADALTRAGLAVRREVGLSERDRIDLMVDTVGIEVKIAGTVDRVHAQLVRYAASDHVDELLVVTTRARHRALPATVGGKPLTVVHLGGLG